MSKKPNKYNSPYDPGNKMQRPAEKKAEESVHLRGCGDPNCPACNPTLNGKGLSSREQPRDTPIRYGRGTVTANSAGKRTAEITITSSNFRSAFADTFSRLDEDVLRRMSDSVRASMERISRESISGSYSYRGWGSAGIISGDEMFADDIATPKKDTRNSPPPSLTTTLARRLRIGLSRRRYRPLKILSAMTKRWPSCAMPSKPRSSTKTCTRLTA